MPNNLILILTFVFTRTLGTNLPSTYPTAFKGHPWSNVTINSDPVVIAYTNKDRIDIVKETSNNTTLPIVSIKDKVHIKFLSALSLDFSSKKFFFTEFNVASIQSISFTNTNPITIYTQNGINGTFVISFDTHSKYLYATIYNQYEIIRLEPIQNAPPKVILRLSALDKFRGLVVDPCESKLFWTNGNTNRPSIQRATVDGRDIQTILDTEIDHPRGLSIDHKFKKLYWGDRNLKKIEEIDFDGKNRRKIPIGMSANFFGIAISALFLYWTDREDGKIYRVNRNGDEMKFEVWRENLKAARGIVMVEPAINKLRCDRPPNLDRLNNKTERTIALSVGQRDSQEKLVCIFDAGLSTKVDWIHNGTEIKGSHKLLEGNQRESVVTFQVVELKTAGNYSCVVSNNFEIDRLDFYVDVCTSCLPKIDKSSPEVVLTRGQENAILSCRYKTRVSSQVVWTRDEPTKIPISFPTPSLDGLNWESVIKIPVVDDTVTGFYNCSVSNKFGLDSLKFYVNVVEELSEHTNLVYGLSSTGLIIFVLIIILFFLWKKYKIQRELVRKLTADEIKEFFEGNPDQVSPANNSTADLNMAAMSLPFDTSNEIPISDLILIKDAILGQGEFGLVYRGNLKGEAVAIKTLKPKVQLEFVKALLSELKIMSFIGHHPHIVKFLGAQTTLIHENVVHMVVELSPMGDLHSFLKKNRSNFIHYTNIQLKNHYQNEEDETPTILPREFLKLALNWCVQIADGMSHLEAKKVVHSDLAARNILIFSKNLVKISDFGLSRQLINYSKYMKKSKTPVPFRWISLESLRFKEFTSKSDVWSYGVTIWEIFSLAEFPYPEFDWTKEFVDNLIHGMRLVKPQLANNEIYNQMIKSWHPNPEARPDFQKLRENFQTILNNVDKIKGPETSTPKRYQNEPTSYVKNELVVFQDY